MSAPSDRTTSLPPAQPDTEVNERARSSRRAFVFLGALAATALAPSGVSAQARKQIRRPTVTPKAPISTGDQPGDSIAAFPEWQSSLGRLVRRTTLGITNPDMMLAEQLGYDGYLEYQLNYSWIDDSEVESQVATLFPLLAEDSNTLFSANTSTIEGQLKQATIYRAAFSQRQLYHRMVELWSDHFNQAYDKVQYLLVADQRDVIREHALGKFPDLLKASAHSPSMLVYLDQNTSRNTAPNQNYAREIMELHTLSVNGGYTQTDVAELSRVLTGWTTQGRGNFAFNPAIHDWGSKTVLGVNIPAGSPAMGQAGIDEGEQMLNVLAYHPSTAVFISTKMLRWLLDPNPTDAQIATVAAAYRATGGDIKAMIRVILNESWLMTASMKLKRPFHFLVSGMRSTAAAVANVGTLNSQLEALGQPLFGWETPDGYPDQISYWAGNIVPRWAFGAAMSNYNSPTTVQFDTTAYRAGSTSNAIDLIDQNFFGGEMPLATRTELLGYLNAGTFNDARVRETLSLAMSANAFQWY